MIEKIDKYLAGKISSLSMSPNIMIASTIIEKINELVDAINVQEKLIDSKFVVETKLEEPTETIEDKGYIKLDNDSLQRFLKAHPEYNNNGVIEIPKTETTDPYEEQHKWIGNLCRFRDDEDDDWESYGILTEINSYIDDHLERCILYKNGNNDVSYSYCEPLDLNDYIIIAKKK